MLFEDYKMIIHYGFLIFSVIGSFGAQQADIDINRLQRIPKEDERFDSSPIYIHGRRSIDFDQTRMTHGYDDYIDRLSDLRSLSHILYSSPTPYPKNTVKIHQPRENPKLYYQSDAYIKEVSPKNVNNYIIATYPGRKVIRVSEYGSPSLSPRKTRDKKNRSYGVNERCIRCPRDRTLISKAGLDRVVLQAPRLVTCSGHAVSYNVKFIHMYGPKFGSYVTQGSHTMVGRITLNDEPLQLCKMEIHVIAQSCPVPKYLVSNCDQLNRSCNFTCKDTRLEILGDTSSVCSNYMEWENDLPICRARRWCHLPIPPEQGRISCKGNHVGSGAGMAEGSKCRIRCGPEWRPTPHGVTVCRRGAWTHNLQCQPKSRYLNG